MTTFLPAASVHHRFLFSLSIYLLNKIKKWEKERKTKKVLSCSKKEENRKVCGTTWFNEWWEDCIAQQYLGLLLLLLFLLLHLCCSFFHSCRVNGISLLATANSCVCLFCRIVVDTSLPPPAPAPLPPPPPPSLGFRIPDRHTDGPLLFNTLLPS